MNPSSFEIGVAIVMVSVSIALVAWFSRHMAAASGRRMMDMLAHLGLYLEVVRHGDTEAIMRNVRSRCRRCRSEDLCDRWLAGKVDGDNSFCPNAPIFRNLPRTTGRIAP